MYQKEYEMMRAEILQYMEEYQSVRNMMYVVTAAILAFSGQVGAIYYLYLVPLIVILPSFMLYYSYTLCVEKASMYLQVFMEDGDPSTCYQWEGRHYRYCTNSFEWSKADKSVFKCLETNIGKLPYVFCAAACMGVYIIFAIKRYLEGSVPEWRIVVDIIVLLTCILFTGYIFSKFWQVDLIKVRRLWESVKMDEEKSTGETLNTISDAQEIILAQWQTCVEMANSVSQRRDSMNNIFITLNIAIITAISVVWDIKSVVMALAGFMLCIIWILFIKNFKQLNQAKFSVIIEMEKKLPMQPFDDEWRKLQNLNGYGEQTKLEKFLPILFAVIYVVLGVVITFFK